MDLTKLKYGTDYYGLPRYTICFITEKARESFNNDKNILTTEDGNVIEIEILDQNGNGFTYNPKNKIL